MFKKRIIASLACAALAAVSLAGCSGGAKDIDVTALAKQIAETASFDEPLTELDADAAERAFRVDPEDVAAVGAWIGSGATVDEVSVWECKDNDDAEDVEEELRARIENRKADYADYKPEEVPKLDNAIIERSGKYVVACVTPDAGGAKSIIDAAFNES